MIPAKADPEAQAVFWKSRWSRDWPKLKRGNEQCSLWMQPLRSSAFLGFLWSVARYLFKLRLGATLQCLGALNAITHELITVTNDTYINAESLCELLQKRPT